MRSTDPALTRTQFAMTAVACPKTQKASPLAGTEVNRLSIDEGGFQGCWTPCSLSGRVRRDGDLGTRQPATATGDRGGWRWPSNLGVVAVGAQQQPRGPCARPASPRSVSCAAEWSDGTRLAYQSKRRCRRNSIKGRQSWLREQDSRIGRRSAMSHARERQ